MVGIYIGKNYINGEWESSTASFENYSPNNPEMLLGEFPQSSAGEVHRAVAAARAAYPAWKRTPAPERAKVLYKLALVLEGLKEQLTQEAVDMAYFVAGEGRRLYGKTTPSELPDKLAFTQRKPIGVCGLITPWNFPIAVPSWKLLPCLLAGNTVVFKPSEHAPLMGQRFVEAFEAAGLPKGVLNLVQGGGDAGEAMINHPEVRMVSFTGSPETGAKVAAACGRELKRVALELGGKNACIVMEDADLELAARGIAWGAFGTSGQRCTATSRLLVQASVKEKLMELLLKEVETLNVGDTTEGAAIGPLISADHLARVEAHIQRGLEEGARLRCGGKQLDLPGHFIAPTIFDAVTPEMSLAQAEIFGPVLSVMTFESFDEAIEMANGVDYGLSSAIFTNNMTAALRAVQELEAGISYVNAPSIGAEVHLPFGGVKKTGNGFREAAEAALDAFTEWQTVYMDYSGTLQRAQIDNH